MELKEIIVVSQPRSGNAWLTRLLGDVLDSPLQTHNTEEEPEYFGKGRNGDYIIRKTHRPRRDRVWSMDTPTILLQRDPRDVIMSRLFYRRLEPTRNNLMATIKSLVNVQQPYDNWIRLWQQEKGIILASYEGLQTRQHKELLYILRGIEKVYDINYPDMLVNALRAEEVYEYQQFDNIHARYGDRFEGSMHKGISGNWKNYFFKEAGDYITNLVGALMIENGYINNMDWWKELDKAMPEREDLDD